MGGLLGVPVTDADAKLFVNKFAWKDVNNLYLKIEKNGVAAIQDSVLKNTMSQFFLKVKIWKRLGYILYAKQVEPYVTGNADAWEPIKRDSVKMAKLIKNGQQLYAVAKEDFFKLKLITK